MERGARRQARETSWVGNTHRGWITANARVSPRFWQLPRQRCLPRCPVLPVPAAAPAPGSCSYPAFSHIALLFSILFKLYLIPHNIILLQVVFPVTGKMRDESWHLSASWHRAAGGTCHHTLPPFCPVALRLLRSCAIGFLLKAPCSFQLRCFFSILGSLLLHFPFFPPLKGIKSKGHLILLIPLTDVSPPQERGKHISDELFRQQKLCFFTRELGIKSSLVL